MLTMKINGGRELHALLQQLPVKVETRILRNALARGAKVIQQEAILRAPVLTGELRDSIKTTRDTKRGRVTAKVKLRGHHSYLGYFFEYGASPHIISVRDGEGSLKIGNNFVGKEVQHPGVYQPFMRPALDAKAQEAINVIGEYFAQYIKLGDIQAPTIAVDVEE